VSTSPPAVPRRSPFEQVLRLISDVRAGEGPVAALLLVNVFLILSAYYALKTVREGLILTGGMLGLEGDELKIYASAAMAVLLIGVVRAYGWLASRVRRIKIINVSYAVVLGCLAIFFVLGRADAPIGLAFFLWLGIVNHFLVGQFWSYANDVYTEDQGKRLFPMIAVGASLGGWIGPKLVGLGDTFTSFAIAGGILTVCLVLFNVVERRLQDRPASASLSVANDVPLGRQGGFQLVLAERYILLIALMLILSNLVNTMGEYILSNGVKLHAAAAIPDTAHAEIADAAARIKAITADRRELINDFYSSFNSWMNGIALVVQLFLVSRIIKYAGVRVALFVLPFVALTGYGMIGLIGGFGLLRVAKIAENATDYSLQNTVRHALWLPTTREAKYKAKSAVDTFFVRLGDAVAAGLVFVGLHHLGLSARDFALVNVAVIGLWIAVCVALARRHKAISEA